MTDTAKHSRSSGWSARTHMRIYPDRDVLAPENDQVSSRAGRRDPENKDLGRRTGDYRTRCDSQPSHSTSRRAFMTAHIRRNKLEGRAVLSRRAARRIEPSLAESIFTWLRARQGQQDGWIPNLRQDRAPRARVPADRANLGSNRTTPGETEEHQRATSRSDPMRSARNNSGRSRWRTSFQRRTDRPSAQRDARVHGLA